MDTITIGKKIQRARYLRRPRLTQEQLAREVQVARVTLARWEAGYDSGVPSSVIDKLATVLDVPAKWLTDGQDTQPPRSVTNLALSAEITPIGLHLTVGLTTGQSITGTVTRFTQTEMDIANPCAGNGSSLGYEVITIKTSAVVWTAYGSGPIDLRIPVDNSELVE